MLTKILCLFTESNDNSPTLYEVLFDEEFLGGLKLRCSSHRAYRLPAPCLLNISHGRRLCESDSHKKKSYKSHATLGTSYASAASGREQQTSYWKGQSYGNERYQSRGNVGTKTENRHEKLPKNGHSNGRGRGGGNEVRILQRNSSDLLQNKQESQSDELSAAVDALSKLSVSNKPDSHETKELSPSVAAMFSALEQQEKDPIEENTDVGSTSIQDHSSNLKSMLRIGDSTKFSAAKKEVLDRQQLSQPRAPLLPQPPHQYPPPQQPRGDLYMHMSLMCLYTYKYIKLKAMYMHY